MMEAKPVSKPSLCYLLFLSTLYYVNGFGYGSGRTTTTRITFSKTTSFLPSTPMKTSSERKFNLPSTSNRNNIKNKLSMLVEPSGKDALIVIAEPSSPLSKGILKTPPKIRKIASLATIPAATILGYVMTPSRRLVAHAVGAGLTGIIGTVTKSRIDAEAEEAAKPAVAKLFRTC